MLTGKERKEETNKRMRERKRKRGKESFSAGGIGEDFNGFCPSDKEQNSTYDTR